MQTASDPAADLASLADRFEGELLVDDTARRVYATDASEYQERRLGVVLPASDRDVGEIIWFAAATRTPLIPCGAGTSLAGQVVGKRRDCRDSCDQPRFHDTSRMAWAELTARVGEEFPLECAGCGGDIRLMAVDPTRGPSGGF